MGERRVTRVCFEESLATAIRTLGEALKALEVEVIEWSQGLQEQYLQETDTLFVVKDFEGELFLLLQENNRSIIGLTLLQQSLALDVPLSLNPRPLHNLAMNGLTICFNGITKKDNGDYYLSLLRYMGGCSRKDLTAKTSHLVAINAKGTKYRLAVNCGVPTMKLSWIEKAWEERFNPDFKATSPEIISQFTLKPFSGLALAFIGFNSKDTKEMEELTLKNGGDIVQLSSDSCTHLVIDAIPGDNHHPNLDIGSLQRVQSLYVVYKEWFWESIDMVGRADETKEDFAYPLPGSKNSGKNLARYSRSFSRRSFDVMSPLDFSRSLDSPSFTKLIVDSAKKEDYKSFSKRRHVCLELLETERNYMGILKTIITVFKTPLEDSQFGNYLDETEMKIIFGNVPPIFDIHKNIFAGIEGVMENWAEECSIGSIFVTNSDALLKSYPPFFNFFENTKEMIIDCDAKYPRFHAFLKKCESKPECGRQTLTELLIRPVQRIPSVILLLSDLLKCTDANNPDHAQLEAAIERLKVVMSHINEDKRKTEGQIKFINLVNNDIENCPASLLSANRQFICRLDAKLLLREENSPIHVLKGYTLTLFLFTDILEICKKRSVKRSDSMTKSTGKSNTGSSRPSKKCYRHIELVHLESIKWIHEFSGCGNSEFERALVIDIYPTTDTSRCFKNYPFLLIDDKDCASSFFVTKLSIQTDQNRAAQEKVLMNGTMQHLSTLDFESAENFASCLSKSNFSGLTKTTKGVVSRVFSMRRPSISAASSTSSLHSTPGSLHDTSMKTPSPAPRRLSRAVSSFFYSNFGGTPLSRKQMSTNNLNELTEENNENVAADANDGTFSLPTTPAPRKKKCQAKTPDHC